MESELEKLRAHLAASEARARESLGLLGDLHGALVLWSEYTPQETVGTFAKTAPLFDEAGTWLLSRQYDDFDDITPERPHG